MWALLTIFSADQPHPISTLDDVEANNAEHIHALL
jgi:hypothetical protein